MITRRSPWSFPETLARLSAVVAARGMKVFAVIDQTAAARAVGLDLRETSLIIVGDPTVSTAAIHAEPLAALELPLRVVVWLDGHVTNVSYPSPVDVARRYGLGGELAAALEDVDAVTTTVIDR